LVDSRYLTVTRALPSHCISIVSAPLLNGLNHAARVCRSLAPFPPDRAPPTSAAFSKQRSITPLSAWSPRPRNVQAPARPRRLNRIRRLWRALLHSGAFSLERPSSLKHDRAIQRAAGAALYLGVISRACVDFNERHVRGAHRQHGNARRNLDQLQHGFGREHHERRTLSAVPRLAFDDRRQRADARESHAVRGSTAQQ